MSARASGGEFHAVLLAGGSGTRFWPLSRASRPKQLLALIGRDPLILETWRRARRLAPPSRLWVVAPQHLARAVQSLLPELSPKHLIVEPSPRDTAPAVTLACATISRSHPRAVIGIFPTDHVVADVPELVRSVRIAAAAAARGALVCLGIRPDRPATGFGYLKCASLPHKGRATEVVRFVEKPDAARARAFLRSGRYLWNAGMFVWSVERYLAEARRVAPAIVRSVESHLDGRRSGWARTRRQSVDYAVMERARGVQVVPLDAGWDDIGSWEAAVRLRVVRGGGAEPRSSLLLDSPGSEVFGEARWVAIVGVPGVIVVDTPDALLVCARSSSERVKGVVEELRRRRRLDLL